MPPADPERGWFPPSEPGGFPPGAVPPGGFPPGAGFPPPPQIGPNGQPIIPGGPPPTALEWKVAIDRLFAAVFGRASDQGGSDFWVNQASNNQIGFDQVAQQFLRSPEGIERFAPDAPNGDFCRKLYEGVLGRLPEDAGLKWWVDQLDAGLLTQAEMLIAFANSPENVANTDELNGLDPQSSESLGPIPNPLDLPLPSPLANTTL